MTSTTHAPTPARPHISDTPPAAAGAAKKRANPAGQFPSGDPARNVDGRRRDAALTLP